VVVDVDGLALDQDPGKSAAMDMKSLGKHIDAVRYHLCFFGTLILLTEVLVVLHLGPDRLIPDTDGARGDGNLTSPRADLVVLWDRAAEHSRPDSEGYHALPGELHEPARAEPARVESVQARVI